METKAITSDEVLKEFKELVNMTPATIEKWLDTPESKEVGFKNEGESESVGHQSGKKIINILQTKKADLTNADYQHMHKVIAYIKRHSAQRPTGDIMKTRWRYSLMNWGQDPMKK
jgi:hypothetical protein